MINSKLYSILEYFDKYEQNRLRKYLVSPYFNKNKANVALFESLIRHIDLQKNGNGNGIAPRKPLTKEMLWQDIFAELPYDDVRFRKLCSDSLKLIEGFLAQQLYEENPLHQATYLIEAVGRKKMQKLYNSTMRSARRLSDQQCFRPATYYYYQYQIEKNYFNLAQFDLKRSVRINIEKIANNLDHFYLAEKLRVYCDLLTRQYIVSHQYRFLFIEEIINHIEKYKFEEIPPIAIYYQIFLTLKNPDAEVHYFKLRALLDKYGHLFPINEAEEIYGSALNYCIRKVNVGNQKFQHELFQLYSEVLKKELIFVDGQLSPWDFKNIVLNALRNGKFEWTEHFIHEYKKRLPAEFRENAVTFNLAQLYFYQKKYENVISLLQTIEYEDYSYNINSKVMLLATYYEMDEIEPLYSLMESFRAYLNRNKKIAVQRRKHNLNLIKFLKKLTKVRPGDTKSLLKIREEIDKTPGISSVQWLKEKIDELV